MPVQFRASLTAAWMLALVLLLSMGLVAGCKARSSSPVVGEWELDVDGTAVAWARGLNKSLGSAPPLKAEDFRAEIAALKMSFQLNADGTCVRRQSGKSVNGSWTLKEGVLTLMSTGSQPPWTIVGRLREGRLFMDLSEGGASPMPPGLPAELVFKRK